MKRKIGVIIVSIFILSFFLVLVRGAIAKEELVVQSWLPQFEYCKGGWEWLVRSFEKKYPDVDIKVRSVPFGQCRILLIMGVAAGDAPDISNFVPNWTAELAAMGALEPMEKYFTKEELNNFVPSYLESLKYKGKLYGIPWQGGPITLTRNKDLMRQAGFDPNKPPENWNELTKMIKGIGALGTTPAGEKIYGIVLRTSKSTNSAFWSIPVIWGFGGRFSDDKGNIVLDSPEVVKAFQWYKEMSLNKLSPVGLSLHGTRNIFALGRAGFQFEGPWTYGNIRTISGGKFKLHEDYDVSLMPKGPDGISRTIDNTQTWVLTTQSKHKDIAVKFIKYATFSKEWREIYWRDAHECTPPYKPLQNLKIAKDPYNQVFIKQMATAIGSPYPSPKWSSALEFVAVCMQEAILGGDVPNAVKRCAENIRTLLGQ